MKEAYKKLKEQRKSYIVYVIGQQFIDLSETLISQINKYSKYPVVLYYSEGKVNFDYPNLIKQKFEFTGTDGLDFKGLDPVDVRNRILSTCLTKPFVVKDFLNNYQVEEFVFLDADILVSPNIDSLFTKYSNHIENYPLFLKYTWDIIFTQGRPHVSDRILKLLGINRNQTVYSLCAGFFMGNINCKSFFNDWSKYCSYQNLIDYWIEDPSVSSDFNDETVANALVWLYEGKGYVMPDFLWTWKYESVNFAFDFYEGKAGELPIHSSLSEHYKIPEEYEIPTGLSVIPVSKRNFLGTHGIKDPSHIKMASEEIDRRF